MMASSSCLPKQEAPRDSAPSLGAHTGTWKAELPGKNASLAADVAVIFLLYDANTELDRNRALKRGTW